MVIITILFREFSVKAAIVLHQMRALVCDIGEKAIGASVFYIYSLERVVNKF